MAEGAVYEVWDQFLEMLHRGRWWWGMAMGVGVTGILASAGLGWIAAVSIGLVLGAAVVWVARDPRTQG